MNLNGWVKKNLAAVVTILVLLTGITAQAAVLHYKVSDLGPKVEANQKAVSEISGDIKAIKATVEEINYRMDWIFREAN